MEFFTWAGVPGWWGWAMAGALLLIAAPLVAGEPGRSWRLQRRHDLILSQGVPAQAHISHVRDTHLRLGGELYVLELRLRVADGPHGPAFDCSLEVPVAPLRFGQFSAGRDIQIKLDPKSRKVAVDQPTR